MASSGTPGRGGHQSGGREVEPVGYTERGAPILAHDEKGRPVFAYHLETGRPICGFRGKNGPCKNTSRMDNGRCNHPAHGGKRPKGIAHPNYKDGTYSKVLPPVHLRDRWTELREDPELLHHTNMVAITDSLLQDVFDHYEEGGTPGLWRQLGAAWQRLEIAQKAGDKHKAREFFAEIGLLIEQGGAQTRREAEALKLMEQRRRHADSQLKRETAEKHTWTYEAAAAFYVALGAAVRRHCTEDQILAIERDLSVVAANRGVHRTT